MKKVTLIIALMGSMCVAHAQDSNVLVSLNSPAYGVRIKANFPGNNGNWARGYYLANEDNTKTFFGFGVLGGSVNGAANFSYGWIGQDYNNTYINFLANGNVGIGTITPAEKLSVNGNIRAKEIKVETANWPDYVFDPAFKVMSLSQTEVYIKEHHHLPGIPSAKEVSIDGVNVGEMQVKMLEKIEELTLHVIEQQKIIDKQTELLQQLIDLKK